MNYVRRFILAIIIMAFISCAWYGAEMIIHGVSQRSAVDIFVAIMISLSISGKLEKGAELNERKQAIAEKFADEFTKQLKERTKADGAEKNDT